MRPESGHFFRVFLDRARRMPVEIYENVLSDEVLEQVRWSPLWSHGRQDVGDEFVFRSGLPPLDPIFQAADAIVQRLGSPNGFLRVQYASTYENIDLSFACDERLLEEKHLLRTPTLSHLIVLDADPAALATTYIVDGLRNELTFIPDVPNRVVRYDGGFLMGVPKLTEEPSMRRTITVDLWESLDGLAITESPLVASTGFLERVYGSRDVLRENLLSFGRDGNLFGLPMQIDAFQIQDKEDSESRHVTTFPLRHETHALNFDLPAEVTLATTADLDEIVDDSYPRTVRLV